MGKVLLVLICCCLGFSASGQDVIETAKVIDTNGKTDLIDIARSLFHIKSQRMKSESGKNFYFSFLPLSSTVPGGGKALITSTTAGFYLGPRDSTYLSTANFAPYLNFKGRFGLPLRTSLWAKDNSWNIQGDTRFLVYPQYTWGLGGNNDEQNNILVNYKYIRFYQAALKRINNVFYAGIGYNLDYHIDISAEETNKIKSFTGYQFGAANDNNSFSSGITFNLLYDTRENLFNPLPGTYVNVVYRYNTKALGSQNNWQSLYLDVRKYITLKKERKKNQLALWGYYWTTLNAGTPYLDLPSVGWDPYNRSGRGMEQNRYRGQGMFYFETEYRRDISRNGLFGYVLFANATSVTEAAGRNFKYINPAIGGGFRIKFNKGSDTNVAIDYAFSKGYNTFILGLGEAF
ncbi:BamA/TamA family outer membrane protein [Mucilaginibacter boryungensis]|uniref:Surface antigen-like protein n=1 Tax=Mucilaginibacter boryungensis TaxID=768480 RepID=A0ABR9XEV5_9SPHI|nr:hypothetical protein [Mucilaginibacter boryungensis]MBE9665913.1 hypothetical protein [Mucilaginibacter boryungensis]